MTLTSFLLFVLGACVGVLALIVIVFLIVLRWTMTR